MQRFVLATATLFATSCTEPTWYPGLPSDLALDDSGATTDDSGPPTDDSGSPTDDSGTPTDDTDDTGKQLPCSGAGSTAATLTIEITKDVGAILWWRDQNCKEYSYGVVPLYVPREQGTYLTHAWVLRDAVGNYIDHRVVDETDEQWELTK